MEKTVGPCFGIEVVFRVSQAHRRELLQTIERQQQRLAGEQGAGIWEAFEDCVVPNRFLWVEWWTTERGAESSLTSDRFATLRAAIRHLGRIETVRRVDLVREIPVRPATQAGEADVGPEPERA